MGFVGAIATLGAPLASVGCDGVGFGVAAEADVDAADCPAVGGDVEGCADGAEAVDSDADGTADAGVAGLRGVAEGVDMGADVAGVADAGEDAEVGDGVAADDMAAAPDEAATGIGVSAAARIDGSIIGAIQVPEYAESTGAVAHEPVASMSNTAAGGCGGLLDGRRRFGEGGPRAGGRCVSCCLTQGLS